MESALNQFELSYEVMEKEGDYSNALCWRTMYNHYYLFLADAFSKLVTLDLNLLKPGPVLRGPFFIPRISLKDETGTDLITTQLLPTQQEGEGSQMDVYFIFPKGIADFEKRIGKYLPGLHRYTKGPATAYQNRLQLNNKADLIAFEPFERFAQRYSQSGFGVPLYNVEITAKRITDARDWRGDQQQSLTKVVYHFHLLGNAFREIETINLEQVNRSMAQQKGYQQYFSSVEITRNAIQFKKLAFIRNVTKENPLERDKKGIYLHVYLGIPFKEFKIKLPNYRDTGFNWGYFPIAMYSEDMRSIIKLDSGMVIPRLVENEMVDTVVKKRTKSSISTSNRPAPTSSNKKRGIGK
ncbi:hypothetical protein [[Flexibacter] sp. ATCC 35208]|uniref:hypothetical protein n=1 Tax=[Flexibacter] sp. ATCC 35208 TaxID=1936242 RepID=UPI00117DEDF4|nr:hypothetical protein [[Flexibacter] sp. ATCC 35208]